MTRSELVAALRDLWRAYNAVNRRALSSRYLDKMPDADTGEVEDRLAGWFS